jgi:hypothetical protein
MYRLAILLVVILAVIRIMYSEKYTRALDDAYVPTRNTRRVSGFFHACSPESGGCERGAYPFEGLPLA